MEKTKEKKPRYWIVLLTIIVILAIVVGVLIISRYYLAGSVEITYVKKETTLHSVEGIGVNYYEFEFYVDVHNSGTSEVSNLKLVVDLKVDHSTIASDTETIGTLKRGWRSENKRLAILVHRNQLFDAEGNLKGEVTAVITLYSGDEVLDQVTTGVF